MKRIISNYTPVQGADEIDDKLEEMLTSLKDDFDYIIAGIEKLGRSGANTANDAKMISEDLEAIFQDTISTIANKL